MLSKSLKHLLSLSSMENIYFMELSSIPHQELHHELSSLTLYAMKTLIVEKSIKLSMLGKSITL